ncbi:DNA-3-methyladenine glycosylase [Pseudomonas sp. GOM7]|uniref:DNA-3-methyladenine glycosylase family protein n=1 Tax=Pseudomonas sp. GOM7 TaxID=2998079 RepID=UPI00227B310A|nr:DNA-3-methyladenine glycosylase [Pseudomonas sp. GOM7]WAJ35990.1 DNA-3-methyladenine glycosylase [Pseudomonas sp. GOM7]
MANFTLLLPYQSPWQWQQFQRHFALRAVPGLEALTPDSYARGFAIDGSSGWLRVTPLPGQNALELRCSLGSPRHLDHLEQRVRRMFDLDAEPQAIAQHLSGDALLAPLVQRNPGLRLPVAFDPFEQAVRAIVGQQVTVKAAVTLVGRLVQRVGTPLQMPGAPAISHLFPSPQALAEADLTGIGMPGKRVQCLQHFAARVADGSLQLDLTDGSASLIERLCRLPGIGPWTAEYIALRAFGEADAFPASDLGLLKAPVWGTAGIDARRLTARAEAWRPWRAYAAAHLWHNYAGD